MSRRTGNNYSGARWAFSQRQRGNVAKIAVVRDENFPVGVNAPCWMTCTCGEVLPAFRGDQLCKCGTRYDASGWVLS